MIKFSHIAWVFLGSGAGGVFRYLLSAVSSYYQWNSWHWATILANFTASFLAGVLLALAPAQSIRLFALVGFCGGLSTFSTFSVEVLQWMQAGDYKSATLYVLMQVTGCVGCAGLGWFIVKESFSV